MSRHAKVDLRLCLHDGWGSCDLEQQATGYGGALDCGSGVRGNVQMCPIDDLDANLARQGRDQHQTPGVIKGDSRGAVALARTLRSTGR